MQYENGKPERETLTTMVAAAQPNTTKRRQNERLFWIYDPFLDVEEVSHQFSNVSSSMFNNGDRSRSRPFFQFKQNGKLFVE